MKKKVTITAVVIICILLGVAVALSANRAGGEIGFEATINSVENGVAYATVEPGEAYSVDISIPYPVARQNGTNNVKITATTGDTTATYKESFTH